MSVDASERLSADERACTLEELLAVGVASRRRLGEQRVEAVEVDIDLPPVQDVAITDMDDGLAEPRASFARRPPDPHLRCVDVDVGPEGGCEFVGGRSFVAKSEVDDEFLCPRTERAASPLRGRDLHGAEQRDRRFRDLARLVCIRVLARHEIRGVALLSAVPQDEWKRRRKTWAPWRRA